MASVMIERTLENPRARAGDPQTVRAVKGDRPQVGAVELYAWPGWLKGDRAAVATLTPSQARSLAIELLQAAEIIEHRVKS